MNSTAPMVAGYDGSAAGRAAVEWAGAHAELGAGVIVVTAVATQLAELRANPALFRCAWRAEVGWGTSPVDTLLEVAHKNGAGAIVVGSRYCGDSTDGLIHRSDLPVVVVPR